MTTTITDPRITKTIAAYEEIARINREDDWGEFVEEALDDPASIAYEVADVFADIIGDLDDDILDDIFLATYDWLIALPR